MARSKKYQSIPTFLHEDEFNEFVLPHLTKGSRGPETKISYYRLFNYILKFMHTGCQWEELPIEKDGSGKSEIHYTRVFRIFQGRVAKPPEMHNLNLNFLKKRYWC